jgi:hypothetical protein
MPPVPRRCHPYRSASTVTADERRSERGDESDDAPLLVAIALVGALGLVIGLVDPGRTLEPSLGVLLLYFAVSTYAREHRPRRTSASHAARLPVE